VKVSERELAVFLTEEGRQMLELASVNVPGTPGVSVYVQDADDMGLWIRAPREDGDHILLIRWEYVLSLDFRAGETKSMGLRG
jgi:hypothetical protein